MLCSAPRCKPAPQTWRSGRQTTGLPFKQFLLPERGRNRKSPKAQPLARSSTSPGPAPRRGRAVRPQFQLDGVTGNGSKPPDRSRRSVAGGVCGLRDPVRPSRKSARAPAAPRRACAVFHSRSAPAPGRVANGRETRHRHQLRSPFARAARDRGGDLAADEGALAEARGHDWEDNRVPCDPGIRALKISRSCHILAEALCQRKRRRLLNPSICRAAMRHDQCLARRYSIEIESVTSSSWPALTTALVDPRVPPPGRSSAEISYSLQHIPLRDSYA